MISNEFISRKYTETKANALLNRLGRGGLIIPAIHIGADMVRERTRHRVDPTDIFIFTDYLKNPPGDSEEAIMRVASTLSDLPTARSRHLLIDSQFHPASIRTRGAVQAMQKSIPSQKVFGVIDINNLYPQILLGAVDLKAETFRYIQSSSGK